MRGKLDIWLPVRASIPPPPPPFVQRFSKYERGGGGGDGMAGLPPAWVSWIAAYAAMTKEVAAMTKGAVPAAGWLTVREAPRSCFESPLRGPQDRLCTNGGGGGQGEGGDGMAGLPPAWVSWIAAYAAMTKEVAAMTKGAVPAAGWLTVGEAPRSCFESPLRGPQDRLSTNGWGGTVWPACRRPGFPGLRPTPQRRRGPQ